MIKIGKIFFLISCLSLCLFQSKNSFAEEESVVALVNGNQQRENEVSMGQSFLYTIVVSSSSGQVGEPRLPDLSGFSLLDRGTQVESRSEFINGKFSVTRKQIFNYRLAPESVGEFLLTPAEVNVGDKTLRSNSVNIKVLKTAGNVKPSNPQPSPGAGFGDEDDDFMDQADSLFNQLLNRTLPQAQNVPDNINPKDAFFIRVEVDKKQAYIGEQITASWYLYTKNNLSNFEPIKYPDLRGFWKEDIYIATQLNFKNVVINGESYRKAPLVSYALFPIKAGTSTIDSYKLRATAIMANPFGMFGKPYTFTKVNPPVKVTVLPLPTNQPKDFTGAVGSFNIKATADKTTVPSNEPFSLKVRIDGRGNAKQIDLPPIPFPENFEQYDTKSDSKFSADGTSYKDFEILIIPRSVGEQTIPAVSFSYFDPIKKSFETKSTQPIKIRVTQGKDSGMSNSNQGFISQGASPEKSLTLPGLVYKESKWDIPQKTLNHIWMGLSVFSLVLILFFYFKEMNLNLKGEDLHKKMQARITKITALQGDKKYREAGVAVINLVDMLLREMTHDEEALQREQLFGKLSPRILKILNEGFKENLKYFETLGFAPDALTKELSENKRFKSELKDMKDYLAKALKEFESSNLEG